MELTKIWEGWRNTLIPPANLIDVIEHTYKERLVICESCPAHSKNHHTPLRPDAHCTICSCPLISKLRCLSCDCPEYKWNAQLTSEEEKKIKNETQL